MDYSQAFAISAAGMEIERTRVDVAALNLANANTVQMENGARYQPLRVMALGAGAMSTTTSSFAAQVDDGINLATLTGLVIPQAVVEPSDVAPRMVYEPGHPFANKQGFVGYPGVNTATEMVTLMSAIRGYEANVAALNTTRTLALKTLDIGGTS